MAKAIIIGGGIIGLSSAFYLNKSGWEVTVIDKTDMQQNCSTGNMGYISPSHFVPLASPGIVRQGLRWMLNDQSPFYVQPRLSKSLLQWGFSFMRSASQAHVNRSAVPLCNISMLSKKLYEEWNTIPGFDFSYKNNGMLEYFKTRANEEHAKHIVDTALQLGLTGTELLSKAAAQALEPQTELDIAGAILFRCDGQLWPNQLMKQLQNLLQLKGVIFKCNEEVKSFETKNKLVSKVVTNKAVYESDLVVVAAGAWSSELAAMLQLKIPLVAGRGYSFTLKDSPCKLNYPAILTEGRVAITPINQRLIRFGGTMEITKTSAPPNLKRVKGILKSVKDFLPQFDIAMPAANEIWYGYRPCSADGLPYIGRNMHLKNCIVATGHAMLGISLGPATGKLVNELANETDTSMDISAFNVHRFE